MVSTKHPGLSGMCLRGLRVALSSAIMLTLAILATPSANGQTFTVLYAFTGSNDSGVNPYAGLIQDNAGNLYGTTLNGARHGTIFKLDSAGVLTTLHNFEKPGDGRKPQAGLVRDPVGNLFGMTPTGVGSKAANGIIYRIATTGKEAILYRFTGGADGGVPLGGLIRDQAGNLYGGTAIGGTHLCGVVFKLHKGVESTLHTFTGMGYGDGCSVAGDLVRDDAGNLYGTTSYGGIFGCGTVFKLDTAGKETVLHAFNCPGGYDAGNPKAGLILDQAGNLYGTTISSGSTGAGTVFKIGTTGKHYTVLYTFSGGTDGSEPWGPVVRDTAGNLYGTTRYGGNLSCRAPTGCGVVFKLSATGKETVLHAFSRADGMLPYSGLILDLGGGLYGTTPLGGSTACRSGGCGIVFKITP